MKKWILRNADKDIKTVYGNPILNKLLVSRGIDSPDSADRYLNACLDGLLDPFFMKDMDAAVERIDGAIKKGEKVIIYGDYDVDGIMSTSILYRAFKKLGMDVSYYIPDRMNEGYGINCEAINYIKSLAVDLIITVDCGITSIDEVEYVKSLDMDIIITDHHECKEMIPDTIVLNPKRPGCEYPYKHLAGCGVAFKLVQALWINYKLSGFEELLDLAAIGTVADIVELTGENRIIVKNGLRKLKNSEKQGVRAIKAISGIDEEVNSYNIAFQIAPRINAAGRLSDAKIAVELFITRNNDKAMQLAKFLDQENKNRQKIEDDILNEAINKINQEVDLKKDRAIVLSSPGWHIGVVGIVASRILERYRRPVFLICEEGSTGRGSGRSIEGFNLFGALCDCSELLNKFGGHEMAAGITLDIENIDEFRMRLNESARKIDPEYFIDSIKIDLEVDEGVLDVGTANLIKTLEPFGCGNPAPVLCLRNTEVISRRALSSNGQHLKYQLGKSNYTFEGIFFKAGRQYCEQNWKVVDTAFNIDINEWNNNKKVQLILKDIRPSCSWVIDNIKGNYYKNIKNMITDVQIGYEFEGVQFTRKNLELLKDFMVFNRGYLLVSSLDSIDELEPILDLYSVNTLRNAGFDGQIIVNPEIENIDFGKNEILIYDFLPGEDIYRRLVEKTNSRIYNFYSEDIINKLDTFLNDIVFDRNLLLKICSDIVYNGIVGTVNNFADLYGTNPYKMYRVISFLKEKGIVDLFIKEDMLKIMPRFNGVMDEIVFDSHEDIQYIKILKIKNKIQSILREE